MELDCDAVVIGSGAGGMAAALALARSGLSVQVLEQHHLAGGWCHSFVLDGYRFSPGVHYVGNLGEQGRLRKIYEGLGVAGDLVFLELNPDGYDHILIEGEAPFDIPAGEMRFKDRLLQRFPHESTGIEGYFRLMDRLDLGRLGHPGRGLASPVKFPFLLAQGTRPLKRFLETIGDPRLRTILAMPAAGDYGLAPSRAPAVLHSAVTSHYLNGAWYPRGGGFAIPRAFSRGIRRAAGKVRLRAPVEKILLDSSGSRKRALGVRLAGGEEIRCRAVISNADPMMTFAKLVGRDALSPGLRKRLSAATWSVSTLSLFMAVDMDLEGMGFDSGNYWYTRSPDLELFFDLDPGRTDFQVPGVFVTITTLKDKSKRRSREHTIEAFAFCRYDRFRSFADRDGKRSPEYLAFKETLTKQMIAAVGRVVPGVEDHISFSELGTPLTNRHYVAGHEGAIYGTEKTLRQIGPMGFGTTTEIENLFLCGASTQVHGVMGVTTSGLLAAGKVLGCRVPDLLKMGRGQLRTYPAEDTSAWPSELRPRMVPQGKARRLS
ncbi:MAG TPA: NAD(P)/FAD-dependent oxidoreductase [Actinomycetota bacterium]|nr:NAD(P)/FAD-dependent oxidoreductase [Actinomycetota bacterium]